MVRVVLVRLNWLNTDLFIFKVCRRHFLYNIFLFFFYPDIDECSVDLSPCHQLCNNIIGSFRCDCVKGFELKGKTVCEVIGKFKEIQGDFKAVYL